MATRWTKKRVLITVRTYPTPARKGVEVSCTAGITADGEWIRLYPIPYRSLDADKQFAKYQWIDVDVAKARNDTRPESYTPNLDSIRIGGTVTTADAWRARKALLQPLVRKSLCAIQRERDAHDYPTLGVFRPRSIDRLTIKRAAPNWDEEQLAKLNQTQSLFETKPLRQLEKIPFDFVYAFHCDEADCKGHNLTCTDWEMAQSYRKWRQEYGKDWERPFRQKYEHEMTERFDTYFFVGNLHQFPNAWIVVGLFYPPKAATGDLFDAF